MPIVLKDKRRIVRDSTGRLAKDPLFVPYPVKAKFHRSTLAFEDFKREFSKVGWRFEFANRFAHSTNVNYMNFHFVNTPDTWYAQSVRFAVAFGKFLTSVYAKIVEHYEPAKILFFHYSICDNLDYLNIYKRIYEFLDADEFDDDNYLMLMLFDNDWRHTIVALDKLNLDDDATSVWLTSDMVYNSRLFSVISKQTFSGDRTKLVKKPKFISKRKIAIG